MRMDLSVHLAGLVRGESKWAGRRHELVFSPSSKMPDLSFAPCNDSSVFIYAVETSSYLLIKSTRSK